MAAKNKQRGAAMAEVILATAVIAVVGGIWANEAMRNRRLVEARNIGEYMAAFQSAAVSYATDNNAAVLAAAADGTGAAATCVGNYVNATTFETLNNTTKHTCAVDVSWLIQKGYLPASFKTTNALFQAPAAVYRRVYNGATATANLEMIVVAASGIGTATYTKSKSFTNMNEAFGAANVLGTNMGVVPADANLPGCVWDASVATNRYACGTQGAWNVKLSDFVN
ncbi:hypothetical protein ABIC83_002599 [Roseateles asaccharophilus]|uniref:hypothetical protein n=1 Tax=Roseateles asaccharophilus TaxID=582607 RepID=UPI003838FD97